MKHSTVIDIGSSKVSCMTAGAAADGALVVRGVETRPYRGYRLGGLPEVSALGAALDSALTKLHSVTGLRPRTVCVGVPAPFVRTVITACEVDVASRSGRVTDDDIDYLFDCAQELPVPEGFILMHSTPFDYRLDGLVCDGSPVGRSARKLSASFASALADERFTSVVTAALAPMNVTVGSFISGEMACAAYTIPFSARLSGAIMIDCGGTHCDVSAIRGNALIRTESIGIGGSHFTSDVALGLRLPMTVADELKRRYVFGLDYGSSTELVRIPSEGVFAIEHSTVQMIIEARADELSSYICEALDSLESELPAGSPVYMVGGVASMRGAVEYLSHTTGRKIVLNMPENGRYNTVNYAPVLALAQFMLYGEGANAAYARQSGVVSRGGRMMDTIKDFFIAGNKR